MGMLQFNVLNPQTIQLELVDVLGNSIHKNISNYKTGEYIIDLADFKENLNAGMYFLNCTIGNYRETQRVIVY